MDVSDGTHPTQVGLYGSGSVDGVDIAGNLAYLSVASGLVAVDLSTPTSPVTVAEVESPGFAYMVHSIGNLIYMPDGEGGLVIFRRLAVRPRRRRPRFGMEPGVGQRRDQAVRRGYDGVRGRPASGCARRSAAARRGTDVHGYRSTDSGPGSVRDCLAKTPAGGTVVFDPASFPPSGQAQESRLNSPLQLDKGWVTLDASNAAVMLFGDQAQMRRLGCHLTGQYRQGASDGWFLGGGIVLSGAAAHNQIGGDRSSGKGPTGEGNVIWGNGHGYDRLSGANIVLDGPGVYDNLIAGNIVGPDAFTWSEAEYGAHEVTLQNGASWNRIGSASPKDRKFDWRRCDAVAG